MERRSTNDSNATAEFAQKTRRKKYYNKVFALIRYQHQIQIDILSMRILNEQKKL